MKMMRMMINMMGRLAVGGDIWGSVDGGEGGSEGRDTQTHFNHPLITMIIIVVVMLRIVIVMMLIVMVVMRI